MFAAADGKSFVYDNLEDENQVVKIDSHKLTVTRTLAHCGHDEQRSGQLRSEARFAGARVHQCYRHPAEF